MSGDVQMQVTRQSVVKSSNGRTALTRQAGFSLVEVSIVTALMILIAIIGIPAVQGYVIENKVPRVAEDLQRFIARLKVSAIGVGPGPYSNVDQRALINGLRDAGAIQLQGKDKEVSVAHGLGSIGAGSGGTISIRPTTVPGGVEGSGFRLVLTGVNHAACPALAAVLQRMAVQVSVAGVGAAVLVKDKKVVPSKDYDPILADAQCKEGDSNTFEFVIQ